MYGLCGLWMSKKFCINWDVVDQMNRTDPTKLMERTKNAIETNGFCLVEFELNSFSPEEWVIVSVDHSSPHDLYWFDDAEWALLPKSHGLNYFRRFFYPISISLCKSLAMIQSAMQMMHHFHQFYLYCFFFFSILFTCVCICVVSVVTALVIGYCLVGCNLHFDKSLVDY